MLANAGSVASDKCREIHESGSARVGFKLAESVPPKSGMSRPGALTLLRSIREDAFVAGERKVVLKDWLRFNRFSCGYVCCGASSREQSGEPRHRNTTEAQFRYRQRETEWLGPKVT